jgi:hypothetical protein
VIKERNYEHDGLSTCWYLDVLVRCKRSRERREKGSWSGPSVRKGKALSIIPPSPIQAYGKPL